MDGYIVTPGSQIDLSKYDPNNIGGFQGGKPAALALLQQLGPRLEALQEMLYAEHVHKLLIILQGVDTAGKDGTIHHVFQCVNPQGVRVVPFKQPTPEELDHDYLWRVHRQVPASGEMVIFNRSHYEDVLVVRVHNLVPPEVWGQRYDQINAFERMLTESGTTILKFFLHIDLDEQKQRLQARLADPTKQWKFRLGDLDERKLWPQYMQAYQDVLNRTSTPYAPWHLIPANRKWYRDLVISSIMVQTLEALHVHYPPLPEDLHGVVIP